jgi:hypothetical protein
MNDKIRQLAEQAFNKANDGTIADIKIPREFIDEFAQLIVAECAQACLAATDPDSSVHLVSVAYADAVKKHFGVE